MAMKKSCMIACLFLAGTYGSSKALGDELAKQLHDALTHAQTNRRTPIEERKEKYDVLERTCGELLRQYSKPEEHGRIYYKLAMHYSLTDSKERKRALECARKALDLPIGPRDRLRTYIRLGDAIQIANRGVRGEEMVRVRRAAVMPYLTGLKESLKYDIPDKNPEVTVARPDRYHGPPGTEEFREAMRKIEVYNKALERVRFQRDMILRRDTLTSQIASLYSRMPFATEELRTLATDVLQDEKAIKRLMDAVEEPIGKRSKKFTGSDVNPPEIIDDLPKPDVDLPPPKDHPPVASPAPVRPRELVPPPKSMENVEQGAPANSGDREMTPPRVAGAQPPASASPAPQARPQDRSKGAGILIGGCVIAALVLAACVCQLVRRA